MKDLEFERPGRVQITVSMSAGGKLYLSIRQIAHLRSKHLVSAFAIAPDNCQLVESRGRWSLDTGDISFHFEPAEAEQLRELFGIKVRHIAASAA